ncbi:AAEL010128-PA [Aedes aegypti]|uniref:AAEL010128-PA n=1 Tax=Aedes aegypti TaxID=7159 RepID=Q16TT8_AEDAE|nr:AAEL010128-PA [Aedes aegypti]
MSGKTVLFLCLLQILETISSLGTKTSLALNCFQPQKAGICSLRFVKVLEKDVIDSATQATSDKVIHIEQSQLEYIPEVLFNRFPQMETFQAIGVGLNKFSADAFAKSPKLKHLDVSVNSISILPQDVFGTCQHLELINMAQNRLHLFNGIELIGCNKLRQLNVSSNQLIFINWDPLNDLRHLEQIDLSNNLISSVTVPRHVKRIVARNNHIHKLTTDSNSFIFLLEHLDASRNRLSNIDVLARFGKMTYINLSYNRLLNVDFALFKNMPSLVELNLAHNNIFVVTTSDVKLVALESVDLSNNELTRLSEADCKGFSQARKLLLNNNYLVKLEVMKGASNFPRLQSISLNGNDWACPDMEAMLTELGAKKVTVKPTDEACGTYQVKKRGLCCRDLSTSFDELVLLESQKLSEMRQVDQSRAVSASTVKPTSVTRQKQVPVTANKESVSRYSEEMHNLSNSLRETMSRLVIIEAELKASKSEKVILKDSLDRAQIELKALNEKLARCKSTVNQRTGQTVLID